MKIATITTSKKKKYIGQKCTVIRTEYCNKYNDNQKKRENKKEENLTYGKNNNVLKIDISCRYSNK